MTTAPEAIEAQADTAPEESPATLLGAVDEWLVALRVAFARAIDITVLEARLAALNFTLILIVAVATGLLLATGWIALFAATVAWFHELGLSWPVALLLMAVLNLALAGIGGFAIYRMSNNLLFKAIRKFITYGKYDAKSTHDTKGGSDAGSEPAAGNTPPAP